MKKQLIIDGTCSAKALSKFTQMNLDPDMRWGTGKNPHIFIQITTNVLNECEKTGRTTLIHKTAVHEHDIAQRLDFDSYEESVRSPTTRDKAWRTNFGVPNQKCRAYYWKPAKSPGTTLSAERSGTRWKVKIVHSPGAKIPVCIANFMADVDVIKTYLI